MKKYFYLAFLLFSSTLLSGQIVVADSLFSAIGVELDGQGNAWISLTGSGQNDGAVLVVTPSGAVHPAIVGMPSIVIDTMTGETAGPWHTQLMPQNKVAVFEPLVGGLVVFDMTGFVPGVSAPKTLADAVGSVLIADFVHQNQPPDMPDSNPYTGVVDAAGNWYIADAAFNGIVKVEAGTGNRSVFCKFPPFPNPIPVGPPVVDIVPTRIIAKPGGGFYVCNLTGFPFLEGAASVFEVSATGAVSTYASGFSLLTDMALDKNTGDLYVLQMAKIDTMFGFGFNTAKISRIKPGGTVVETVAENFGPAVGLALDGKGNLYATHLFFGLLLKWENVATAIFENPKPLAINPLKVFPNPATDAIQLSAGDWVQGDLSIFDARGRLVFSKKGLLAGERVDVQRLGAGAFFVKLETEKGVMAGGFVR